MLVVHGLKDRTNIGTPFESKNMTCSFLETGGYESMLMLKTSIKSYTILKNIQKIREAYFGSLLKLKSP